MLTLTTLLFVQLALAITIGGIAVSTVDIHDGGAVQTLYKATLNMSANTTVNGVATLSWFEHYEDGCVNSVMSISGIFSNISTLPYSIKVRWWANGSKAVLNIDIDEQGVSAYGVSAELAGPSFNITVYVPSTANFENITPRLINVLEKLSEYTHITRMDVEERYGLVYISVGGYIDVERLAERAKRLGASNKSVVALLDLLAGDYAIEGGGAVSISIRPGNVTVISGSGQWYLKGDVRRVDALYAFAADAIVALLYDATFDAFKDWPIPYGLLLPPEVWVDGATLPLVRVSPSNASLTLTITASGHDIVIDVEYLTHRMGPVNSNETSLSDANTPKLADADSKPDLVPGIAAMIVAVASAGLLPLAYRFRTPAVPRR